MKISGNSAILEEKILNSQISWDFAPEICDFIQKMIVEKLEKS